MSELIDWAHSYDGYARLAATSGDLEALLAPARAQAERTGEVPAWCGVDLLRGWAFCLVRADYFGGGYGFTDPTAPDTREWLAVLAALAAHPDASDADRPPAIPEAWKAPAAGPRGHRDPVFLALKRTRLREPHVAPVQDLVDRIVAAGNGDVPYIDPDSGGTGARVLLLLEAPARAAAHGSGMLSADNDDATAAHVWEGYETSGLPRGWGVHWNAVPWYVGKAEKIRAVTPAEVVAGLRWLDELLDLLPDLRVVVAMGRPAQKAVGYIAADLERRGLSVITTFHPSPRNYNSRPHSRADVLEAFRAAYAAADTAPTMSVDPAADGDAPGVPEVRGAGQGVRSGRPAGLAQVEFVECE